MKLRGTIVLALLCSALVASLHAQSHQRWELALTGGCITPNNFNMPEHTSGLAGVEMSWWSRCTGDEWWIQRRKQPSFGWRLSYSHIPQNIAGDRIGLVGLVSAPLWRQVDYHLGLGLSGFTRSRYFTHNQKNIFITTLLSCLVDVGLDYRVTERLSLSLAFLHSSNGMLYRPNKGLNSLQAGVSYAFGDVARGGAEEKALPLPEFTRHEVGFALQGGAVVSYDWSQQGYFPCYDLSLNYQQYIDPVVALGGTLDLWYNGSHYELARKYGESYTFPCYVSALGYIEGFWGPLSIKLGVGSALVAPPRVNIRIYERLGAYYNFGRHYVGVAVNAHAGMVEFVECAYGYRIPLP